MENKLPEHIQIRIAKEAESLANQWHYYPSGDEYRDIINAYKAGAEPWAQHCLVLRQEVDHLKKWKEEASALLNPILDWGRKPPGLKLESSTTEAVLQLVQRFEQAMKALNRIKEIAKRHGEIQDIINTAVATWNEGMEPNKNTTNDTNK